MCRVLDVSASGYYVWLQRPLSLRQQRDAELTQSVMEIHRRSRQTYGAPRVHAELQEMGVRIAKKRVARLMQCEGIQGVTRRKQFRTTITDPAAERAPDLVRQNFTADGPDQLWVADITYVPTEAGFHFLAVVLDVWSRRVVGWSMADHLRSSLVIRALDMALQQRRPREVVHHSDRGCQYTSVDFGHRCRQAGVRPSMGAVGHCYDNALCESFFATLECELLDRSAFITRPAAEMALFDFIEGWYNPHRRHSSIGQLSPVNFEKQHGRAA